MHELSRLFIAKLVNVDRNLRAIFDSRDDAIVIFALRQGQKVHELTVRRQYAENYEELENRTINKLHECDVWKKFGDGKKYDDHLAEEEDRIHAEKKRELRRNRIAMLKEDREMWRAAVWNAQHGRFTKETVLPFQTASFAFSSTKKNDLGNFTVIDKRKRTGPEDQKEIKHDTMEHV